MDIFVYSCDKLFSPKKPTTTQREASYIFLFLHLMTSKKEGK